jgi:haloalkane dehalogenase
MAGLPLRVAPNLALLAIVLTAALPVQSLGADVISAGFPYESRYVEVLGSRLHYVEEGEGDPILFLHGNPTSSYLWRNVIPFVTPVGRAIAMDLIGFGRSDKPDIAYTAQDHYRFVEGFIEALGLENLTLVLHDWGSVLGLEYARRHPERIKGVAFMEAIIPPTFPMASIEAMGAASDLFRQFRDPERGPELLLQQNVFIEQILRNATVTRRMSDEEMAHYRAPFENEEDRYPILVWPNELPIAGEPARNVALVEGIEQWLRTSEKPKLLLYARPGALVPRRQRTGCSATTGISRPCSSAMEVITSRRMPRKPLGAILRSGY